VKEKIKQLIAEHLIRRGALKITLHNYEATGVLTDAIRDRILDEINEIDSTIEKLKEILKAI
jgi:tetrahydromethanopterin S-methyltransferase subunit B